MGSAAAIAVAAALWLPVAAQAAFGFVPGSTAVTVQNRDGSINTQAGAHPYSVTVRFALKSDGTGKTEGGALRDVLTGLPPGLIGNPNAVPACSRQSFEGSVPNCPPSTQIGVLRVLLPELDAESVGPLFNLDPPPGVAAQFGFSAVEFTALLSASINPEEGYGIQVEAPDVPLEASFISATIWGVPADSSHDSDRGVEKGGLTSEAPLLPFLTMPTSCESPLQVAFEVDSKLAPGVFVGGDEPAILRDDGGSPVAPSGCEVVPFSPRIRAAPTTEAADSATGVGFQLKLPNQGLLNPTEGSITETEPVKTEVTFPPGVTVNPSAASGMLGCSRHQYELANGEPGVGCPEASKIGTLVAQTPLLEEAVEGSVYLATPHDNEFNSLIAVYFVARAPLRGVLIKQAGEGRLDPVTGQISTTFDHLPPLPYSSLELNLREGPRAPLITPQPCGEYTTLARFYPFSAPGSPVERTAPFKITSGANGTPCAASEAGLRNHPNLQAGTTVPIAGSYSPFVFRVSRQDGEQRFSSLQATLPVGLIGKLAGVPYCSEAGIATAASRTAEGGGALELASPSCPAASQVGVVNVAAGAGPQPYVVQGKAYLAGPYKGAPLSLEIITPAVASPFDLGSVAVRTALNVDPVTAQIHASSDPLPSILHGIPLDVRTISLQMNRPDFTLNPTNCQAKTVTGSTVSLVGQPAALSNPFAVGGCAGLKFEPKLAISVKGGTKRHNFPALKATLTAKPGEANIARAQVTLPHSEFLEQSHIGTVCTRVQFAAKACPKASIYGKAMAITPLLDKSVSGPVYLRSSSHKLPDLVAELNGQIDVVLDGKVDTGKGGGIRNTFQAVPDAPVSKFTLELKGGKKGLLVNSENICQKPQRATANLTGQNGAISNTTPLITNDCKSKKAKTKKSKKGHQ